MFSRKQTNNIDIEMQDNKELKVEDVLIKKDNQHIYDKLEVYLKRKEQNTLRVGYKLIKGFSIGVVMLQFTLLSISLIREMINGKNIDENTKIMQQLVGNKTIQDLLKSLNY